LSATFPDSTALYQLSKPSAWFLFSAMTKTKPINFVENTHPGDYLSLLQTKFFSACTLATQYETKNTNEALLLVRTD
jgi:hypothetical protein